jgi:hypothetical protein
MINDAGVFTSIGPDPAKLGPPPVAAVLVPLLSTANPDNPPSGATPAKFEETIVFFVLSKMATKYFFAE